MQDKGDQLAEATAEGLAFCWEDLCEFRWGEWVFFLGAPVLQSRRYEAQLYIDYGGVVRTLIFTFMVKCKVFAG